MRQQFVIDNRAGGAGIIGTEIVARAKPDGYTLLLAPTGFSINPGLYAKLPFDPQRDFSPVSLLGIRPAAGRLFTEEDDRQATVVLGHALWQSL